MAIMLEKNKTVESFTLVNGVKIPILGIGTWTMRGKENEVLPWALDAGYRHIDTAKIYGTEQGIAKAISKSNIPRDEIFITTKLWNSDQGYDDAILAFEESLKKLKTDHIDLYLIHWPYTEETEGENRREETWRALEEIYDAGKARAIGVSNFEMDHLVEMESYATVPPMVNQIERHPFLQQRDVVEYCNKNKIAVTNYSPLTRGRRIGDTDIGDVAEKHNKTGAQVLLRWGIQHGNIVIPKSTKKNHIIENSEIFDFSLDREDMKKLDALDEGLSVIS